MAGGRPTSYSEEILKRTTEYIYTYKDLGETIPTIAGLSLHLGIARSTIYDWISQEEKKEFSDITESLLSTQERELVNGGIANKFNAQITKLILGKHGYSDKQETDITSGGETITGINYTKPE